MRLFFGKTQGVNRDFLEYLNQRHGTRDSDADGLTDEVEEILGTDPYNTDSDADGVDDYTEIVKGGNPLGPGKISDWFVPHAGNDYQPLALRAQRLAFYGLSAILIKLVVIALVMGFPLAAWLSPEGFSGQAKTIIELTNNVRQEKLVAKLAMNDLLIKAAQAKAVDMLAKQYFAHTGPDQRSLKNWLGDVGYHYAVAGENLALDFSTPESVIAAWQNSPSHYANLVDPDFSQIGVGLISGNYLGRETMLAAQYFGSPSFVKTSSFAKATEDKSEGEPAYIAPADIAPLVALKPMEAKLTVLPSKTAVTVAEDKTSPQLLIEPELSLQTAANDSAQEIEFRGQLSDDTIKAELQIGGQKISLQPISNNFWVGRAVHYGQLNQEVITLANLTAIDQAGNQATYDVPWQNLELGKTSWWRHYLLLKSFPSADLQPLFSFSSVFYQIILGLALLALTLGILIEIKKQHPKIIGSTVGLIVFLFLLIMF